MQMTCPKCRGEMRQYERSGVTIDQCTECRGIFLDRGELEKLFEAEASWNRQHAGPPQPSHAGPQPGYAPPPPPPHQPGYAAAPPPAAHGYPPAYGGGHHGYHGHYRRKKHRGFLGELFD
jgi:Zn-finger nucleic acid-binding protein